MVLAVHCSSTRCVPAPDRLIVRGELAALLVMVMLAPLTAPADVGSNMTVNVAD